MPLFHVGGMSFALVGLSLRRAHPHAAHPRSARRARRCWPTAVTHTFFVPALLAAMAAGAGRAHVPDAAAASSTARRRCRCRCCGPALALFPGRMTQVYGMTEASGVVSCCRSPTTRTRPSRTGWSRPGRPIAGRRDRDPRPGDRRAACRRRARRDLGAQRAAHGRLLGQAGGHRGGDHPRRLAALRRRRAHRRRRLPLRHRPHQGHDHQRRREHLPGRDRARARRAPDRRRLSR